VSVFLGVIFACFVIMILGLKELLLIKNKNERLREKENSNINTFSLERVNIYRIFPFPW